MPNFKLPRDCNTTERELPGDPPQLTCGETSTSSTIGSSTSVLARFALVLYGSVGPANRTMKTDDMMREAAASGLDVPVSKFIDVQLAAAHLQRYLVRSSGGRVDTFIHSTVPSLPMRQRLLELYRPVSARFDDAYGTVWRPAVERIAAGSGRKGSGANQPIVEVSRFLSLSAALSLVASAEDARGATYDAIYLTRPDILLWAHVDLRLYCLHDTIYSNNVHPPFHMVWGRDGGPADFHWVMSSAHARKFGTMPQYFAKYDYFTEPANPFASGRKNRLMASFVGDVVGAKLLPDHVVVGRHEEGLRKAALYLHGLYGRWCRCNLVPGKCRHPPQEEAMDKWSVGGGAY